ncbi:hypothetical protein [Shewanella algae]|uniref:hypothetical protein n=1 Tax=Shewanella algae TaxID=38313 RepID=UPI0030074A91
MKVLKLLIVASNFLFSQMLCFLLSLRNFNRKKVLVYTDSRGFKVEELFHNRNPFSSYVGKLILDYNVTFRLMPFKHTTIVDFIFDFDNKWSGSEFDFVILHCGIVDFSPRTKSSVPFIQQRKISKIPPEFHELFKSFPCYDVEYKNELTASLYSKDFLKDFIIPKLTSINGLIFIEPNRICNDWNGSYPNSRPDNMNLIFEYVKLISDKVDNVIPLSLLDENEVRNITTDNVHYNNYGFDYIYDSVKRIVDDSKENN